MAMLYMLRTAAAAGGGAPEPPVACAYPLDASEAEILGFGFAGKLSMSADEQTGTHTTLGGRAGYDFFGAAPTNSGIGTGAKIDLAAAGKVAVEVQWPAAPALNATVGDTVDMSMVIVSPDFGTTCSIRVDVKPSGLYSLAVNFSGGATGGGWIFEDSVTPPTSAAFVYDNVTGMASVRYNGVTYHSNAWPVTTVVGYVGVTESPTIDAGNVGKVYSVRLQKDAAAFLQTFEAGTTDTCANAAPT